MKNFVTSHHEPLDFKYEIEQRAVSSSFAVPKMRNNAPSLLSGTSLKRQKSSSQLSIKSTEETSANPSTMTINHHPNSTADCYKTTSLPESYCRRLYKKHPTKCINYSRNHIVRVYPAGIRIESSNFNPLNFFQFGFQASFKMYGRLSELWNT